MAEPNNLIVEDSNPGVKEVAKQFGVYEDGALAYKLQEEENVTHYSGNIMRRRTVREDREVAKDVAKDVAIEAFREEHEIAERNRKLEEEDRERAREIQMQILQEEQEKALREQEEDRERARLLQLQMIREEQQKALQAKETDEMLARRLQIEEKKRLEAERRKKMEARQMKQDEHLARKLSQQEGHRHHHNHQHHHHHDDRHQDDRYHDDRHQDDRYHDDRQHQHRHDDQHAHQQQQQQKQHRQSGKHREKTNHVEDSLGGMKLDDSGAGHDHSRAESGAAGGVVAHRPLVVSMEPKDSDEESDAIAKLRHDEMLAKKLQREEKQRTRPRTLSEIEQRQLEHDEKIARKMQHEEVMLAKKKTYNRYKQRISDEVADPAPMVHVSKEKKVPVLMEAKESNGVTLTDVTRPASADFDLPPDPAASGGNILASIDPTYNAKSNANVVLTKRTPIRDADPPPDYSPPVANGGPDGFQAIQGTRRRSGKDEKEKDKKRGSIFSKLKKK